MTVKIMTDSTSYIDERLRAKLDIKVMPLYVSFQDVSMKETEIKNDTFYEMMEKRGFRSLPNHR